MSSSTRSSRKSRRSSSRRQRPVADDPSSTTIGRELGRVRAALLGAGTVPEIEEARAESEILVAYVLGADATVLVASLREPLQRDTQRAIAALLCRRLAGEPLRYLTGSCPFFGREFLVDRRVLIPRQESEMIVEAALGRAANRNTLRIADIGTGSGILAVTLGLELPGAEVHAVDISPDALDVARDNARRLAPAAAIKFYRGDLAEPLDGRFDVIVANLPYVLRERLAAAAPELAWEPRSALDGGADGLDLIGRLIPRLPELLAPGGAALLEIDPPVAGALRALVGEHLPSAGLQIIDDIAGLARLAEITAESASPEG